MQSNTEIVYVRRMGVSHYVLMGVIYLAGFFVGGMVAKYNNDQALAHPTRTEVEARYDAR